jgi:dihydrofolate reductase
MRRIIVYIATSADGFISRPDGDVAWLDRAGTPTDYGMAAFYRTVDTVIMGGNTWDRALTLGQSGYPGKANYVFSRKPRRQIGDVEFVSGDVGAFAGRLRAKAGKDIWLVGGADLVGSFLDAGQIDAFIMHVIPIFIGEGIPLIGPKHRSIPLGLRSCRRFADGVVRLHYDVLSRAAALRTSRRKAARRRLA